MAKGNIGNLLQHFLALTCAKRLVELCAGEPIEYIDCYSMAPWETVDGGSPQGFVSKLDRFGGMATEGDLVAATFLAAWADRYASNSLPAHPREREYPNSAVLIRSAFPNQTWNMRLHDIRYQQELEDWSQRQSPGTYRVGGEWTKSILIQKSPAPQDTAVLVMLDPYHIVDDQNLKADKGGHLSKQLLRYLYGPHALNARVREGTARPWVNLLFSYSDADPDEPDQVVRAVFTEDRWAIEKVQSGPWNVNGRPSFHQGWVVTESMPSPYVTPSLQAAWNQWVS